MPFHSKEKKEKPKPPTLTQVSEGKQVGGRTGKAAPKAKNLISKESARYARARVRYM